MMRWCLITLLAAAAASAQEAPRPHDAPRPQAAGARPDTLLARADTTRRDSLKAPSDTSSAVRGIDTIITYTGADSIIYAISSKTMSLYRKGTIRYQKMELQAERIDIDWNSATLRAYGLPDTTDTSRTKERGLPVMKDGGEEYHGKELGYNFQTKRGRIALARTHLDQGYYTGEQVKKMGEDVLFIADGKYTTCDDPDPHYYFGSPTMKVMPGDKVIVEPVYLYVSDVPVFWLPLGVFPAHGGRRSGIIAPAIAEDAAHGRLLRHLGYYWAMNDYMDLGLRSDLYTKGSWALSSQYRYNLRYYLNGDISAEYRKMLVGEPSDPGHSVEESYNLAIRHNQTIDPTSRLDVNFTFASNNAYQNTIDINQALQQDITSNATYSKFWEGSPNSVTVNVSRRQNLIDGSLYEVLPSVSYNHSQSYPLRTGKDPERYAWYENISFGYGASAANNLNKVSRTVDRVRISPGDSLLTSVHEFEFDRSQTLAQNASIAIAPKLGYFTISPAVSYADQRSYARNDVPTRDSAGGRFFIRNDRIWSRLGTVSAGVTASTKLYGILQPGIFGIGAIRHTLSPDLSLTYSKQVVGDNLAPKSMLLGVNVGNLFEMKMAQSEEGKEPEKITLLNLGIGTSYNFSADSLNVAPIGVNFRTGIGNTLQLDGGANFDVYKLVPVQSAQGGVTYIRVNKFLYQDEGRLARMTDFRIAMSTSLAGAKSSSGPGPARGGTTDSTRGRIRPPGYYPTGEEEPDFSIPWNLALSWDYSENKVPGQQSRSSSARGSLSFNLTENWKFTANSGYDFLNREVEIPNISISRDLHCWLLTFSWVPIGPIRQYQFELRLKAPQLQDVKVTKQGSDRGIY